MQSNRSVKILEINILIQRDILKNNKRSKPVHALKSPHMKFYKYSIGDFVMRHKIIDRSPVNSLQYANE